MPEVEHSIDDVIAKIRETQKTGKKHFIIVVAEGVGGVDKIAEKIEETTGIESRATVLGHVQRGGAPSAKDRVIATEMGNYCVNLLKNGISNRVVVMKETDIIDLDILEALKMEKPFDFKKYEMANMINI